MATRVEVRDFFTSNTPIKLDVASPHQMAYEPQRQIQKNVVDEWKKHIENTFIDSVLSSSRCETSSKHSHVVSTPVTEVAYHPIASLAGKYDDEPLWDELMQAIQEYRQEINEQENTTE